MLTALAPLEPLQRYIFLLNIRLNEIKKHFSHDMWMLRHPGSRGEKVKRWSYTRLSFHGFSSRSLGSNA
jgi:hypothetical protein